jgi:hypothetical protein
MRIAILVVSVIAVSNSAARGGDLNNSGFVGQGSRALGTGNLVNPRTGEVMVPIGPNFTGSRDGTVYIPAGPHGVIDTRSGRYIPTN